MKGLRRAVVHSANAARRLTIQDFEVPPLDQAPAQPVPSPSSTPSSHTVSGAGRSWLEYQA